MAKTQTSYLPPRWSLLHTEGIRATVDTAGYFWSFRSLSAGPEGDGHDVLVLPGLLAGDASTVGLRQVLRSRGFAAHSWRQGVNLGPTSAAMDGLAARLQSLYDRTDTPVSLIGWSLGGVLARELARSNPHVVRTVITLGSPFRLTAEHSPYSTHAGWIYRALRPWHTDALDHGLPEEDLPPLQMPSTSIYSRCDGIVPWQACQNIPAEQHENIEVAVSHFGMGVHPEVIRVVLDRLSQPLGQWRRYQKPSAPVGGLSRDVRMRIGPEP